MTVNERKRSSNRSGAVLLTVLTVACFAAVLLTAVISFVNRAHTNAYNNYNSEQAYYIASSALGSIHDYFEKDGMDYTTLLDMADANSGNGSQGTLKLQDGSGVYDLENLIPGSDCSVSVTRSGQGYIKVSVTGYCLGQAETINAYYSIMGLTNPATIDNVLYSNGSTGFGQSASSVGSLTTRSSYNTSNNATAAGSVITGADFNVLTTYKWQTDPNNKAGSFVIAGHNFYINDGGDCTFEPANRKNDDNTSQYISVGGMFSPDKPITIGLAGANEQYMDLYCSTVNLTGNSRLTTYGNVYCYKLSDADWDKVHAHTDLSDYEKNRCALQVSTAWDNTLNKNVVTGIITPLTKDENGDFIVYGSSNGFEINGDLYVEGDIRIMDGNDKPYSVNGTLYVDSATTISSSKSPIICNAISGAGLDEETIYKWIDDGVLRIRMTAGSNNYWTVAQLRAMFPANRVQYIKKDGIVKGTVTSRNYKPSTDFGNYERNYESTEDFLAGNVEVKQKLDVAFNMPVGGHAASSDNLFAANVTDDELGMHFDYVIPSADVPTSSCQLTGSYDQKNILIDMNKVTGDFVVELDKSLSFSNGVNIVIKNGEFDENTGKWVPGKEPDGFCYFIYDQDEPNMTLNGTVSVFDYYTYKYFMKEQYALNLTSKVNSDDGSIENYIFQKKDGSPYKDAGGNTYGVYTPQPCRTYLMLKNGDTFNTGDIVGNCCGPLELIFYAPDGALNSSAFGLQTGKYYRGNGTTIEGLSALGTDARLGILGAIIDEKFTGHNTFGVEFVAPAPGSGVGTSGSESTTEIKFDHYESR